MSNAVSANSKIRIAAVIVTYNRLEKLKKALMSYEKQLHQPDYMVIVNNASTDGTLEWLEEWEKEQHDFKVELIHAKENCGGSGGFYLGEERAMQLPVDWIMIADDDAYPEKDYLYGMQKYIAEHPNENISIVCGKVIEHGQYDNMHRKYLASKWDRAFQKSIPLEDFAGECFYPDLVSYVGILINKDKLLQVGLVRSECFIWGDDTEHSYRLGKAGRIIGLSSYQILHDVEASNYGLSWKSYYGWRNYIDFRKRHFKRYFVLSLAVALLRTILCPIKGKSLTEVKLRLTAIKDGLCGNMGMNDKYKPGWKP